MLLVTAPTGHIGRELVPRLLAVGQRLRLLVRDPARAQAWPDVEHAVVDLRDPEPAALAAALDGIDGMFLLFPGIEHEPVERLLAAARDAGTELLVYVSSYAVGIEPMPAMGRWHHEREELIRTYGFAATVLRPCGFMSNTLDWLSTVRSDGYVLDPVGPGRAALIDPADIAAVAVEALKDGRHAGRTYTLTGDEPMTVGEQVAVLEEVLGIPLPRREVETPEEAVRFRYPQGAPAALSAALVEGLRLMRADVRGLVTDDVARVLDRPPLRFADWCRRHADEFQDGLAGAGRPAR